MHIALIVVDKYSVSEPNGAGFHPVPLWCAMAYAIRITARKKHVFVVIFIAQRSHVSHSQFARMTSPKNAT